MWRFWIDTGGTFTDCLAEDPQGRLHRAKVLSSSCLRATVAEQIGPDRLRLEGALELPPEFFAGYGFRVAGRPERWTARAWDPEARIVVLDTACEGVANGTLCTFESPEEPPTLAARVVTGSLLRDALPPLEMRLATTRGTNALLERKGAKVAFLVTKGFGDLLRIGNQQRPKLFELGIQKPEPLAARVFEIEERLDRDGHVLAELDEASVDRVMEAAKAEGIGSFAVALLHSYRNPDHEQRLASRLGQLGAQFVSTSSALSPFAKLLPRAETTVVDAYLAPIMNRYLDSVERSLGGVSNESRLRVMTSAGGLVSREQYRPKDSLLSGPAGGVVGSSQVGVAAGCRRTIAFDMGGTSTDVSRFDDGFDYRFEQRIGSARVYAPTLRIETVAAGGGSICWFDGSALRVGPESAGANPGPACYGAGGPLAITDANLLLGRLDANRFGIPIDRRASRARLSELQAEVEAATGAKAEPESLLRGFLEIANERMAEAIRKVSVSDGYDPADYELVAFGGAGGMHACAIADRLGMDRILFPADAGLLSAYGLRMARIEQFAGRQVLQPLDACGPDIPGWIKDLADQAVDKLVCDGVAVEKAELAPPQVELRFKGQESTLMVESGDLDTLGERFMALYEEQFGFLPAGLDVEVVALRVVARSEAPTCESETFVASAAAATDGFAVDRRSLRPGAVVEGPVVIQDPYSTLYVEDGWDATVGSLGTVRVARRRAAANALAEREEVVELELFTNRFLSIVDEMGALLERVAFSTNVKDRKDFSCAMLDADGFLVANAPHIPVHLGALGVCVRSVLESMSLNPGDVVVTNHPAYGGSHLPDVTLIAPVFADDGSGLVGYVANRAHHAELGGIAPGSMPPNARNLAEEGVVISPTKLIDGGKSRWDKVERLLVDGPFPTRALPENRADLSAQLAAARAGARAIRQLVRSEGADRVRHFMRGLRERAATSLRRALDKEETRSYAAEESLDNGARVRVAIQRTDSGKWRIDFSGTAETQPDNYNATPAIATSAVIYVLRLLANEEIPLNEGFLDVVELVIPEGMLNPNFDADPARCPAVVAGNVEVSQLVVATLLKAFGLAACSQATMNNLIFGTKRFGYYETIAGGEGATAERDGASGVHTHMTNTAMTDPEIMELRYPVRVDEFALRRGSGGAGGTCGGEGIVKRIRFLEQVTLSLLTQRRVASPFGMAGGEPGACGEQCLIHADGRKESLAGNGIWTVPAGAAFEVRTPGGGGWGAK